MPATLSRRRMLNGSLAALAAALAHGPLQSLGFAALDEGDVHLPFLDADAIDAKGASIRWDDLTDWMTPDDKLFNVGHYGSPKVEAEGYKLEISGLVDKPRSLTLDEIKSRENREIIATLECSGNGAGPKFMGAVGNCRWVGTPLAPILRECGIKDTAIEAHFWAADKGQETIRGAKYDQNFARSLTIADATRDDVLLSYEMNGKPLTQGHGAPLRLIVPGWYGIAWVKWLTRIDLADRRLMNRFTARDYVTVRGVKQGDTTVWRETSVGPMNIKSIAARAIRRKDGAIRISGAAWNDGTPLKSVEVKIDGGEWQPAKIDETHKAKFAWRFWTFDWKDAPAGEHTIVSRATDERGRVQPSADDDEIKLKKTYWEAYAQYPRKIKVL